MYWLKIHIDRFQDKNAKEKKKASCSCAIMINLGWNQILSPWKAAGLCFGTGQVFHEESEGVRMDHVEFQKQNKLTKLEASFETLICFV